jgi:RND family efflux transporter MFP subunit
MKKIFWVAGAIVTGLLAAGCRGGANKAADEGQAAVKAVQVKVSTSLREQVAENVELTASLQAFKQNFVVPALGARIERIYVEVGDRVSEGQLLVDLDKNQYNQYAVQLANAESNLARMEQVYQTGGISKQQMDELETSITVLRETVDNFSKNLSLRSPISGIVTGRFNEEGDLFTMAPNAAGGVGILQVMRIDRLKAYVGVSEQYFTHVGTGMPVEIVTDVYPGKTFSGSVTRIAPAINPATRSFEVEVTIPTQSETLRPGMYARTKFNMGETESVTVDDLAVQRQAGTNDKYVFVVENGAAVKRPVRIGRQTGGRIEIVSGIREGEQVVVAGMSRLADGTPVEII